VVLIFNLLKGACPAWVPFYINLETKELEGGSYPRP
jgi:hypothetical protein